MFQEEVACCCENCGGSYSTPWGMTMKERRSLRRMETNMCAKFESYAYLLEED